MRANPFLVILTAVLCLCMAGTAFGQDNSLVVVIGADGETVGGATVSSYEGGVVTGVADNTAHESMYNLPSAATKTTLIVEHPSFGTRTVSADLFPTGEAITIVQVTDDGAIVKYQSLKYLNDIFEEGELGSPVTPPPGQGCYLPDQQGHGGSGVLLATSDTFAGFIAAECFKPTQDSNLTHAVWWGGYYDFIFGADCGPGQGDDFTITYYTNNAATGLPDAVIASFSVGLAQKFQTGNDYIGLLFEWQFQSTFHAPVPVTAGECYWISIVNNSPVQSSTFCVWLWGTAPPGDGRAAQDNAGWGATDYDLAVCVSAQIDPNGTCAPPIVAPANDDCANCEAISGEGLFGFDNTFASMDGSPDALCDFFGQQDIDNDVWYCWTSPCTDNVTLTTVGWTTVDTKVAVYDSTACPTGAPIACNDDDVGFQSTVQWAATAGSTYLIRMGTFPGASGGVGSFDISCGAGPGPPANDDCANATDAGVLGVFIESGDTTNATADVAPFCGTGDGSGGGVWYKVTGNGNQAVASLCSGNTLYDSKLRVYCGGCGVLVCVGGNDDACGLQSEVVWDTAAGVEYLVLVHGFSSSTGPYELGIFDIGPNTGTPVACSAPARQSMTITSNLPNVYVEVDPIDDFTQGAGLTPFSRSYAPDTVVTLTFPTQVDTKHLMGYVINGRLMRGAQGGVLTGKASKAQTVKAFYNGDQGNSGTGEETL